MSTYAYDMGVMFARVVERERGRVCADRDKISAQTAIRCAQHPQKVQEFLRTSCKVNVDNYEWPALPSGWRPTRESLGEFWEGYASVKGAKVDWEDFSA